MEEQTTETTETVADQPPTETETDAQVEPATTSEPEPETTDWQAVAEMIAKAIEDKQPGREVIQATNGNVTGELTIVHQVTTGDLLVGLLLLVLIAKSLLKWVFKAVWGR